MIPEFWALGSTYKNRYTESDIYKMNYFQTLGLKYVGTSCDT